MRVCYCNSNKGCEHDSNINHYANNLDKSQERSVEKRNNIMVGNKPIHDADNQCMDANYDVYDNKPK